MTRPARSARFSLAIVTALIALGVGAPSAFAERTFKVNPILKDGPVVPSNKCESACSLRQAVFDANESTETDNTLLVPPGTYALTEGQLVIDPKPGGSENIIGEAHKASEVVITAEGKGPVLRVGTSNDPTVTSAIAELEITGGQTNEPGAGIYIHRNATVSLTDTAVVDNTSENRGGGIDTEGGLDVADSVIADNHVTGEPGLGGGIYNESQNGAIGVFNSTIAGNSAFLEGGGLYDLDAIRMLSATIAGNQAGGHGAGLAGDPVEIGNSILAENTVNKATDNCAEVSDTHSLGGNLSDDSSCTLAGTEDKPGTNADLVETGGLPLLADNGGPTETIALQATSPAIGAADQMLCFANDQRGVVRPSGDCDVGAFQLGEEASSTPPGHPNTATSTTTSTPSTASTSGVVTSGPPAPVLARTGNVTPVSGIVLVRLPGTTVFVALSSLRQIPFGTVINATHGRVSVTTAAQHGGTQTGEFFEGEFMLSQGGNGLVVATLTGGSFAGCPTARERAHRARASAAASGKHVVRKLWSDAHGSFSTKGNYAAGTVAGTEWLTEDLCDGTLIRVTRDKVAVTNLVTHHHFLVLDGHSYLAKAA